MEGWLASHALEIIFGVIVALSSGAAGLSKRLRRRLKECRERCRKLEELNRKYQRDHTLSLEFNVQDRFTIRELAKMVTEYREELKLPEKDILLEVYKRAESFSQARLLSASSKIHHTSSGLEVFSDDLE